jgi:hypothetical protein
MSKKPKIDHEYHAGKDKMKITIHGYSLKSKKTRDEIMKKLMAEVERSPDRLIAHANKKAKKRAGKKLAGQKRDTEFIQVGD